MYTILIVDDEKSEREVILFLIKKYKLNLHTLQADNGKAALDILKEKPVDILLTDIKMPFINGMELATKARDIYPDIEILFFSGYDHFEYVKTALSLRAVNYILKPINENEFYKSILTIINTIHKRETQAEITGLMLLRAI
jgi:two-component system, response regulator YesN